MKPILAYLIASIVILPINRESEKYNALALKFEIRRIDRIGFVIRLFKKDLKNYKSARHYLICGEENNSKLIENLTNKMKPLINFRKIYSIILRNYTLTISLRTKKHHFDFFEKLSSF